MNEIVEKVIDVVRDGFFSIVGDGVKVAGGALVVWVYGWYKKYRAPALRLFGLNVNGRWGVYFGNVKTGDHGFSAFDQKSASSVYGDMEATLRVVESMADLIGGSPTYHRALHDPKAIGGSVISIGGPKWNKATEYLIGKLGSPVAYKEGTKSLLIRNNIDLSVARLEFSDVATGAGRTVRDYGVIIVGKKGYFDSLGDSSIDSACVLMGYSTVGVRVAAEYLRKLASPKKKQAVKSLLDEHLARKCNRFCLVIFADVRITAAGEYMDHDEVELRFMPEGDFSKPYHYSYK